LFDDCSNIQLRSAIARLMAALAFLAGVSGAMAASETLYYFVDDRGIPHFTNVPVDARYRPFAKVSTGPAAVRESEGDAGDTAPYGDEPVHIEAPLAADMDHEAIVSDHQLQVQTQEH